MSSEDKIPTFGLAKTAAEVTDVFSPEALSRDTTDGIIYKDMVTGEELEKRLFAKLQNKIEAGHWAGKVVLSGHPNAPVLFYWHE